MIYADNAATTALAPEAFEAMKPFLLTEYGNASQPYSFSRSARAALAKAAGHRGMYQRRAVRDIFHLRRHGERQLGDKVPELRPHGAADLHDRA